VLLRPGDRGPHVADVQERLAKLGLSTEPDQPGHYGNATTAAVQAFQRQRGLRVDGLVGPLTWGALIEAGFALGDRLLYLREPMLRGDDVAELQRRLCALGFDTGRVDGIFGPRTARALEEFQRNVGLAPDGICGRTTIEQLVRVMPRQTPEQLVSEVRAREHLRRAPRNLQGWRISVADDGGLDALVGAVRRLLAARGADVVAFTHPDESVQARMANQVDSELHLSFHSGLDGVELCYYQGWRFEAPGGRRLAHLLACTFGEVLGGVTVGVRGASLPVLRETAMPAVLVELGPPSRIVEHSAELATACASAVEIWVRAPLDEDPR
jgi:N-acetylmuramoyl-L-alanine amidase